MLAISSAGILALAAVVLMTRSSSVTELSTISAGKAVQDIDHYFSNQQHEIKQSLRALPYKSSNAARADLNKFFADKSAKRPEDYVSAKKALKELDYIFPSKKVQAKKIQKEVLAFSHAEAKDDLDSYFDNLDTSTHSHAWSDMEDGSRAYIENKRKAIHNSHGSFTEVDPNGNAVDVKKVWSAANAAQDMNSFYNSDHLPAAHSSVAIAQNQEAALKAAKAAKLEQAMKTDPALKKKLDQVHKDWLAAHGSLPSTPEEKAAYGKMVKAAVGNVDLTITAADLPKTAVAAAPKKNMGIKTQYEIFNAYLDLHPDMSAKFDKFKAAWHQNHNRDHPHTAEEAKEYKALMTQYMGHLDIDGEKVAKEWEARNKHKQAKKQGLLSGKESAKELAAKVAKDPTLKAKLDKVHKLWSQKHGNKLPQTAADRAEYKDNLIRVGLISRKAVTTTSLAAAPAHKQHTPEEIQKAKQRALLDLEAHQTTVKANLDKVHSIWMQHHSAPPQGAKEEKEYDELMAKYVGRPDISAQVDTGSDSDKSAAAAGSGDKMLDLDASFLQ